MHFSTIFAVSALAAAALADPIPDASEFQSSPCAQIPAASWDEVGGNEGTFFCETAWGTDHSPITGIEVWRSPAAGGDHIAGIRFQYASTGDWSQTYGHEDTSSYPSQTLTLAPGEQVTSMILYGNGKGQYTGHIHIETNRGQVFDAGRDTTGITPYAQSTGGGIILGAFGQQGVGPEDSSNDLVDLAFLFISSQVSSVSVQNVTYDVSQIANAGVVQPSQINVGSYYNNAANTVSVGQSQTLSVTQSHSFSQSSTTTYNFTENIDISAKVFGIGVDSDTSFSWQQTQSSTSSISSSETQSLTCNFSANLAPKTGVQATGTFANGSTTVPYTSTVVINLQGGGSYTYQENGQLAASSFYSCNTVTTQDNDPSLANTATNEGPAAGSTSFNTTASSSVASLTSTSATLLPPSSTSATSSSALATATMPLAGSNSTNSLPYGSGTGTGTGLPASTGLTGLKLGFPFRDGTTVIKNDRRLVENIKSGRQMRRWAA